MENISSINLLEIYCLKLHLEREHSNFTFFDFRKKYHYTYTFIIFSNPYFDFAVGTSPVRNEN